jgi:PAS domain S-box-containing protein
MARILVVEDEIMLAKELTRRLTESGHEVVGRVVTGADAIEQAGETKPDLILMDIKLKGPMDGVEAAAAIQSSLDTAIVYMTAHTADEIFSRAKLTDPYAYLIKPVSPHDLQRTIDIVLYKRRMDSRLRESEQRFRAIFESSEQGIYVKDQTLRFVRVNHAMCRLLGRTESEMIGKRVDDCFPEEWARVMKEMDARVLQGEAIDAEQRVTIQGETMTFVQSLAPLTDSMGVITGLCGMVTNITGRKRRMSRVPVPPERYRSQAFRLTAEKARLAAETDSIVLLQGESGTGKDFVARWIHDCSPRKTGPFFAINCAALPKELAESELFGHERGAFTGALALKRGLLELAEGGTILLNEIAELDVCLQTKLLAFLDTRSFLRVGGQRYNSVNARLMAASHRNLQEEVAEGRFLKALFYRLNVFPIVIPPLRDRLEDIPLLVEQILSKLATDLQLPGVPVIDAGHRKALAAYSWPGNVRELRNVLEQSLMLWKDGRFTVVLPTAEPADAEWSYTVRHVPGRSLKDVTDEVERSLCEAALRTCNNNKKVAAQMLDISRDALSKHIRYIKRITEVSTSE